MTGYVRKDTSNNIADGNIINSADLDAEFDGVVDAFNASTGHKHDGTTAEGAPITVVGPTQDVAISATAVTPKTTNTVDLGSSSLKFKDIYIVGTASLPTVNATTVDTTNIEVTNIKAKDGTASASIADSTGVMTIASAILTTADINGGTIDGTAIGGNAAAAGAFTTLSSTGNTTLGDAAGDVITINGATTFANVNPTLSAGTANGVAYLNGSKVLTTGSALTFDGTTLANLGGGDRARFGTSTRSLYFYADSGGVSLLDGAAQTGNGWYINGASNYVAGYISSSEQMRLTSTGLSTQKDATIQGVTVGRGAGAVSTNTAVGASALAANTTGSSNAAFGSNSLLGNTTGVSNVALGGNALIFNTTGSYNTAVGAGVVGVSAGSLGLNTTGSNNTALGFQSLYSNTTASNNTAVGYQAAYANTTGDRNIGVGLSALAANTTGIRNTVVGTYSYNNATACNYVTAVGHASGNGATGDYNTFIGESAGGSMTSGAKNTILGRYNGNQGGLDIRTASNYIVLSDGDGTPRAWCQAGTSGWKFSDNGSRDDNGQQNEFYQSNNTRGLNVRCSNASLTTDGIIFSVADRNTTNNTFYAYGYYNVGAGAYKFRVADSGNVTNTNNSYGGISDIKLKENIVDATPKLADLQNVRIVNYNRIGSEEKELGVIAQELEQVFPALVETHIDRDREGNDLGTTTKSVKYSVFVPMLIKAIQELKAEFDAYKASHP